MTNNNEIRTAEWARCGHPDRVADILADSLLDEYLKQDPNSRVAIEVFGCHGIITVGGEVTSKANVNVSQIVKDVYKEIGYNDSIGVQVNIVKQSPEISDLADEGAGDSGIVTGYACNETKEKLPLEVVLAKRIADKLDEDKILLPDGKIQVTLENGLIKNVVVAYQAKENEYNYIKTVVDNIILDINLHNEDRLFTYNLEHFHFVIGGFDADVGLSGRKLITPYGPRIPIGGGNFSGKDPSKVDRSGAYLARKIAIEELEKQGLNECFVELAYVIGRNEPLYLKVNGENFVRENINVSDVLNNLKLRRPIFKNASMKGHFGYLDCPWE